MSMTDFRFSVDHAAGLIYNSDSLPYATNTSKVIINITTAGVPSIYVDSTDTYEAFMSTDSIDFTSPRKFRVYSEDASYFKDYTVSINVHQVDPDRMVWGRYDAVENLVPVRLVERDGMMYLFGYDADGNAAVATTSGAGVPQWNRSAVTGLPATAGISNVQLFGGRFYVVCDGDVYASEDALSWSATATGVDATAIVGVSDDDARMWVAGESGIYSSSDGAVFTLSEALPEGFPLYGVSLASCPLSHNGNIIRYTLVGFADKEMEGGVTVWSRLSTEKGWTCYDNVGNSYTCPSLKGLSVVRYDNSLYAMGGAGKAAGQDVAAFNSFFVSKDNGIVWKAQTSFIERLPEELKGYDAPFAVAVGVDNNMWIVSSGENGGVWKGIINRLGFKK